MEPSLKFLGERQHKLLEFVIKQHGTQKRKYIDTPYWYHPVAVAKMASEFVADSVLITEVALCHDLLEDTDCTSEALYDHLRGVGYGDAHAKCIVIRVEELTDQYTKERFPDLRRSDRKKLEAERLGTISFIAQSVKYADLIDNTGSIVEHDPGFAKTYLKEKRDILQNMRNGNIDLFVECCYTLKSAMLKLENAVHQGMDSQ